jgi:hypothetical protein
METIAFNFHDEKRVLKDKYLKAGDDAANVKWLEIDSTLNLFASHKDFMRKVVEMHGAHWGEEEPHPHHQHHHHNHSADSFERKSSARTINNLPSPSTIAASNLNASRTSIFGSERNRSSENIIHTGKRNAASATSNKKSSNNSSVFVHTVP